MKRFLQIKTSLELGSLNASMTEDEAWDWVAENTEVSDNLFQLVYDYVYESVDNAIRDAINNEPDDPNHAAWNADIGGWELDKFQDFIDYLNKKGITDPEDIKNIASAYESRYDGTLQEIRIAGLTEEFDRVEQDKKDSR